MEQLVSAFDFAFASQPTQATQIPIAICKGNRISRRVKIRWYWRMMDTFMTVRAKL
jgi:hypothetical protein